ncbi:NADH-ubiquinone oxidoreductase [Baekduia soli]|uniref:NADH-ubiquinone oxidoreductase n=1 Tax=Baekduia soli TaxID=496014 RepID=A0A5B8U711_9ACTN|nr:NADH-quinone oxidoreductase subunit C [Baekduia soli]QEC48452.1 NADH-ubiquinone oxidoreductase [Baekduia soli]
MTLAGPTAAPPRAGVTAREVAPGDWVTAVASGLAAGHAFAGLHALGGPAGPGVRLAMVRGAEHLLLTARAPGRRVASVAPVLPAAVWDEREAHDLHGWAFTGHEPMRPLADHGVPTAAWTPEVDGRDVHQMAVGPVHAGIIESGHFRFQVVGERILHVDLRLFYKHRGLEAAAEGLGHEQALAHVQRACAADAVANTVAYAQACEAALGLWPTPGLRRERTLLLELERLYNHLHDLSAVCAGVGFAPGAMLFGALKERAQRLNARLCGHRFLFGTIAVGRSGLAAGPMTGDELRGGLVDLAREVARAWHELQFAGSLQDRLEGTGLTAAADVLRLGAVGPAARAAGVAADARTAAPRLAYDGFAPAVPEAPTGDVAARVQVRAAELTATLGRLDTLLAQPPAGPAAAGREGDAGGLGAATVESPRGATTCVVELAGDAVARVHLRTGSYANWPLLALAVRGELLADFPLINKSFELCYACVDR